MMIATTTGGTTPKSAAPTTTPFGARSSTTMDTTTIGKRATPIRTGVPAGNVKESAASLLVPKLTDAKGTIASQYCKMKKKGLPDDAVRHNMTVIFGQDSNSRAGGRLRGTQL